MATDDELAQTATAAAMPSVIAGPPREMLGRFRLEAILGQGGMGIVHLAFDPELERKIALKLLRKAGSDDARARLLREARAMAKLSHPNVISVFDVGSADGEDFVAMELIDGETLGEWLGRARPDPRAIVAAFIAAGRGLAAAHAAALVHRDFKPSNVLRSRTGSVVVTDFGLARTVETEVIPESGESSRHPEQTTHTETGAIVGTPAYMAPEQWTGGSITAATDQFAFCLALWEALAGARAYRGDTIDELRTAVLAGSPRASDRIPRSLRPIMRRGLATDPAQRWPSMPALLAALERTLQTRRRWIVVGVLGLGAAIAITAALGRHDRPGDDCLHPGLSPDAVWFPSRAVALAMRDRNTAHLVSSDVAAWRVLRSRTCAGPTQERPAKLACLDAALARLDDAIASALAEPGRIHPDALALELVDPSVCDATPTPRLAPLTTELAAMFHFVRHTESSETHVTPEERALADHVSSPCASAVRTFAQLGNLFTPAFGQPLRDTRRDLATHCEDDKIRAAIAAQDAWTRDDLDRAEAVVSRCPESDLRARIEASRAQAATLEQRWDAALTGYKQAIELYGVRRMVRAQLGVVLKLSQALLQSGRPEDFTAFGELSKKWRPFESADGRSELDNEALELRWRLGELAAADAELERLGATPAPTPDAAFVWSEDLTGVTGEVVDHAGVPVPNATVSSGAPLVGDSATAATQRYTNGKRTTRTSQDGTFTLILAHGAVVAHSGALRSKATIVAPHVRLVLEPTSQLEGTVTLGTTPASRIWVVAHATRDPGSDAIVVAPVRADGSFRLDGVPRGEVVLGAVEYGVDGVGARPQHVVVHGDRLDGITLALTPPLYVIGRSTDLVAPEAAMIWVTSGFDPGPHPTYSSIVKRRRSSDTRRFGQALPVDRKHLPPELAGKVDNDDVMTTISDRPEGELVVCGIGIALKQFATATTFSAAGNEFLHQPLACIHIGASQSIVTVDLLPFRRFQPK